jgi:hypothetical protein
VIKRALLACEGGNQLQNNKMEMYA